MKRIFRLFKQKFLTLIRLQDDPDRIANGYALGIFLATTPLIGMKVFIALGITWLCKWNKAAAIAGVYHVNSLTAPLFYGCTYWIGSRLTGNDAPFSMPGPGNIVSLSWDHSYLTGIPAAWLAKLLMKTIILKNRST